VPGPAEPGRVEDRFRTPPKPLAVPQIEIPGPEAAAAATGAAKIHFKLADVVIEGATVFSKAQLGRLYRPLVGQDVTLAQLFELRDAITAKYRAAGYILSQAIIPPQKIAAGIIRIRVIEGYVARVEITGNPRAINDRRHLIQEMGHRITRERPLTASTLERYVLLIGDIPGISVRTVLKPSKDRSGAADLVLILERKAIGVTAEADNRGSKAIGPFQGQAGIDLNSVFGLDEQLSLRIATTGQPDQLQYGELALTSLVGPVGLRFENSVSYSVSKPGGAIAPLNAIGHTLNGRSLFEYPLIRSRSENLHVTLGFTYLNTKTMLLGALFSDDRLRYASASTTYDVADTLIDDTAPAQNLLYAELSRGFDILDASKTGSANLSRANGHSDFTRFYLEATRTQSVTNNLSVALSMSGQIAAAPLLTTVQFGLGGARFGRGYEPSELTGDDGIAGSAEARYDFNIFGHPEFYAFYDIGQVWNIDAPLGTAQRASLASAGGGVRFSLTEHFFFDLELAKPLTRPIASRGNKDIRPLFNVSTNF
jgi:hemolysin activation/secretion protein